MKVRIKDVIVELKNLNEELYIKEVDVFRIQNSIKGRRIIKLEKICEIHQKCWFGDILYHPLKMKIDERQRLTNCGSILSMPKPLKVKQKKHLRQPKHA